MWQSARAYAPTLPTLAPLFALAKEKMSWSNVCCQFRRLGHIVLPSVLTVCACVKRIVSGIISRLDSRVKREDNSDVGAEADLRTAESALIAIVLLVVYMRIAMCYKIESNSFCH